MTSSLRLLTAAAILALSAASTSVLAQQALEKKVHRVALVIGNQLYQGGVWEKLNAPAKDAKDAKDLFQAAGFKVAEGINLDGKQLRNAIADFVYEVETIKRSIRTRNAEQTEAIVALFFYSGHGFALSDSGYLPGVDAEGTYLEDVLPRSYRLAQLVNSLTPQDGDVEFLSVLMIDACRKKIHLPSRSSNEKGGSFQKGIFAEIGGFGRIAIFASTNGKASYDARPDRVENSVFTEAIKRAASDQNSIKSFSQFVSQVEALTPTVSKERFDIRQLTEVSKVGVVVDFPVRAMQEATLVRVAANANNKSIKDIEVGYIALGKLRAGAKVVTSIADISSPIGEVIGGSGQIRSGEKLLLSSNPVVQTEIPIPRVVCQESWITVGPLKTKGPPNCKVEVAAERATIGTLPKGLEVTAIGTPEIRNNDQVWLKVAYDRQVKF